MSGSEAARRLHCRSNGNGDPNFCGDDVRNDKHENHYCDDGAAGDDDYAFSIMTVMVMIDRLTPLGKIMLVRMHRVWRGQVTTMLAR